MIPVVHFAGKEVAVLGLGASGLAAVAALRAGGAQVHAWDDREAARFEAQKAGASIADVTAPDFDWSPMAAVVVSPGVPVTFPKPHPAVARAQDAGVPIIGDIELFALAVAALPLEQRPQLIAITGTNGKSTTTALIGHILKTAGRTAHVGGNIGTPALALEPFSADAAYVLEVSSFQLETTHSLAPDVAVWLNLSPDHLDRHGDFAGYGAAKRRIFQAQGGQQHAVVGVDDAYSHQLAAELTAQPSGPQVAAISAQAALSHGVHAVGGVVFDALDGRVAERADLRVAPALLGRHNWQNAAAAYAATRLIGVEPQAIIDALVSFDGLAHRMELVAEIGAVRFVNDSKATNTHAARQALGAFESVHWIAGGRAKGEAFEDLRPWMGRVAKAYLIGEAGEQIAAALGGRVAHELSRTLDAAVAHAARDAAQSAAPAPVVLLSPACASFDQFPGFEARGEAFRALARALADDAEKPA